LSEIEVKREQKMRKGEAGTIVLSVPKTEGLKSLTIELPEGVTSTSGSSILLSGSTINVDVPLLVTKEAPAKFTVKFHLVETKPKKGEKTEFSGSHDIRIIE
jgi:hypothetical protein